MVNPVYIIVVLLGTAFLLGLSKRQGPGLSRVAALAALAFATAVSAGWLVGFMNHSFETFMVYTAGLKPPFSINLRMGVEESFLTLALALALLVLQSA